MISCWLSHEYWRCWFGGNIIFLLFIGIFLFFWYASSIHFVVSFLWENKFCQLIINFFLSFFLIIYVCPISVLLLICMKLFWWAIIWYYSNWSSEKKKSKIEKVLKMNFQARLNDHHWNKLKLKFERVRKRQCGGGVLEFL